MKHLFYFCVLTVTLLASCTSTQLVLLPINFEPNTSFIYRESQSQDITVEVMGLEDKSFQNNMTEYLYEVTNVAANGNTDYEITIKNLAVKQESSQSTVEYNSKESGDIDANNPSIKVYQKMLGQQMNMTLDKNGNVVNFSGADAMYDRIFEDKELQAIGEQMKTSMKAQFGDGAMKENIENRTAFFPPKGVKVGQTWERTQASKFNLGLITNSTYKLLEVKNEIAFINVESTITSNPEAKGLDMGVVTIKYDLTGTQNGIIQMDVNSGWLISSNIKQQLSGTMIMNGEMLGGETSAGLSMDAIYTYEKIDAE